MMQESAKATGEKGDNPVIKLSDVIKIWNNLHHINTGDVFFWDLGKAIEQVLEVHNDFPGLDSEWL